MSDLTSYTDPVTVAQKMHYTSGPWLLLYKHQNYLYVRMIIQAAKELAVNVNCLAEIMFDMPFENYSVAAIKAEYKEALRQNKVTY